MKRFFLVLSAVLLAAGAGSSEAPRPAQLINLSCVEALAAVDQAALAGVFSYIAEKDGPAAFADLIIHDKKALKKFMAKCEKDLHEVKGVSVWDHEALQQALSIYGSPLGETLEKLSSKMAGKITELIGAPVLTLEEMTLRRRQ